MPLVFCFHQLGLGTEAVFNLKLQSGQGEMGTGASPVWVWGGGMAQRAVCPLAELGEC